MQARASREQREGGAMGFTQLVGLGERFVLREGADGGNLSLGVAETDPDSRGGSGRVSCLLLTL